MNSLPTEGVYAPPTSDVASPAPAAAEGTTFFPVSVSKLVVLNLASVGMYTVYWFYKNWQHEARRCRLRIYPFWRAVFYVFFTHELFRSIRVVAAERGVTVPWQKELPTIVVVLTVANHIVDRITWTTDDPGWLELMSAALLVAITMALCKVQRTVNMIHGDHAGALNSQFSIWNVLVVVFGSVLWLGTLGLALVPEWFDAETGSEFTWPANDDGDDYLE